MDWYQDFSEGFRSFLSPGAFFSMILVPVILLTLLFIFILMYYKKRTYEYETKSPRIDPVLTLKFSQFDLNLQQSRILRKMITLCRPETPEEIFKDPLLFETSVNFLLADELNLDERAEPLEAICKNIIMAYEKIYHHSDVRQPLALLTEIEENRLIYLTSDTGDSYIGKITGRDAGVFRINLLGSTGAGEGLAAEKTVRAYIWRSGDSGYYFNPEIIRVQNSFVDISIPEKFDREPEPLHVFVDTIIPCTLSVPSPDGEHDGETVNGVIFKLNEYEVIIRTPTRLDYQKKYQVSFKLSDFKIKAEGQMIRFRFVAENRVYHYNCKFTEISGAARTIIRNHMVESLS